MMVATQRASLYSDNSYCIISLFEIYLKFGMYFDNRVFRALYMSMKIFDHVTLIHLQTLNTYLLILTDFTQFYNILWSLVYVITINHLLFAVFYFHDSPSRS